MEIQFTNIDNLWVAEFEVTKDFNLHLERDTEGRLDIYQRTAGGDYEYIYDIGYLNKRTVYDNDFQALVYPKWIKIKSAVKPLVATITTDGEVNEVVYQAKDIEITSNGTTKVTADTGYTALASVNVKVDVPTEGGGSGENTLEYIDVRNIDSDLKYGLINSSSLVKIIADSSIYICPSLFGKNDFDEGLYEYTTAIAIDFSSKVSGYGNGFITIKEMISIDNGFPLNVISLPRITKEEFYNLNA